LKADALREKLHRYGDSLLVVGDEETVKVHIHTNHPGQVLEELLGYGTLHDIKIDNMRDQHREYVKSEARETKEEKRLSVVAVAQGEGLMAAFKSLGADVVLSGGQTMNPSTEEFVKAVEGAPAMEVLVLPNNKNVILAARQAEGLTSKRIAVVPTRSIPQGIAALVAFNPELGLEENAAFMAEAAKRVKTGEVTYAVRSSRLNGHEINAGDILGLIDGELVVTGGEVEEVAEQILASMVNGGSELITIFAGQDVTPEAAEALRRRIQERFAECEVELHVGGQPLYYYILSVE
ncbi:MAG: fatty acid kinase, partial [Bacillota bacterium]|nr:fatty acid kinase [Bacillota bacterium]